jgi:hypothetical protein
VALDLLSRMCFGPAIACSTVASGFNGAQLTGAFDNAQQGNDIAQITPYLQWIRPTRCHDYDLVRQSI